MQKVNIHNEEEQKESKVQDPFSNFDVFMDLMPT